MRGGARPGTSGTVEWVKPEEALDLDRARAEHEQVKIEERRFKLDRERGLYVERAAVQQASATVMATLCQSLLTIRDNLERTNSVPQDLLDIIDGEVTRALQDASTSIQRLGSQ